MAAPLFTSNAIYAPPARRFRVDPLSFLLGGAVGALVYHFVKAPSVQVVLPPKVEPKPVKQDRFVVQGDPRAV